jgi:hypothetical protein
MGALILIAEPLGLAELLERAWRNAPPGREAAMRNELMREFLRRLRQSADRWGGEREIVSRVRPEIAPEPMLPSLSPG